MRISRIFHTINGESTYAGFPFVIVRMAGCNLDCSYCDTPEARSASHGRDMSLADILAEISRFACPMVLLTGGEPLLQEEIPLLTEKLLRIGYVVLMETNGSLPFENLHEELIKVVDLKCPSSGMKDHMLWANLDALTHRDQVKFVVADRRDLEWMYDVVKKESLEDRVDILISPVFGRMPPRVIADFLLEKKLRARLQLQLHKWIWENYEGK